MSAVTVASSPKRHERRTFRQGTRGLLKTARVRQWIKNGLIFAAPFASGELLSGSVLRHSLITAAAFCLAASGTYFVNDAADVERDRLHPKKRFRPVATGVITPTEARIVGGAALCAGLGAAALVNPTTLLLVGLYVALTLSYSTWLKHIAVVDVVAVATGFLLRAIAGATAGPVNVNGPFLAVCAFGALFLVAGKREGERLALGEHAAEHRRTLSAYTEGFNSQILGLALTGTVLSYVTWAFNTDVSESGVPWLAISSIPFIIAMLRGVQLVIRGEGSDPEEFLLHDRGTQLAALGTAAILFFDLYIL